MKLTVHVTQQLDGLTVKQYFASLGYSTRHIKRLKYNEDGGIRVNGIVRTVRYVLHTGDVLELVTQEHPLVQKDSVEVAKVVYEDEYLYVADKPFGIASHPDRAHNSDTFGHMLGKYYGEGFELHIVTRLDLATSGLVLGALDEVTAEKLNAIQIDHLIHKTYYALTVNKPDNDCGTIDLPLKLGDDKTIISPDGKRAVTHYQVIRTGSNGTLIQLTPLTGRTHQLRAHLAEIRCPIKGDVRYGAEESDRVYLHMAKLDFVHPVTGKRITVESPLPFDVK